MSKCKVKPLMGVTIALLLLLFCVKVTGEVIHALLGLAFTGIMIYYMSKQGKKLPYVPKKYRIVDIVLIISLGIICISGVLLHPLNGVLLIKIVHKLASVVLCIALIWHVIQHKKKGNKRNVS